MRSARSWNSGLRCAALLHKLASHYVEAIITKGLEEELGDALVNRAHKVSDRLHRQSTRQFQELDHHPIGLHRRFRLQPRIQELAHLGNGFDGQMYVPWQSLIWTWPWHLCISMLRFLWKHWQRRLKAGMLSYELHRLGMTYMIYTYGGLGAHLVQLSSSTVDAQWLGGRVIGAKGSC